MKTNVYTQNLEWLRKRVSRFPHLVKVDKPPLILEPEEQGIFITVPFYNYTVIGFVREVDYDLAVYIGAQPFDLASLVKPKA